MNGEAGILYVATGEKFARETVRSARSAKDLMPSVPIALFTDKEPCCNDLPLFDEIHIVEEPTFSFFDKILPLKRTPFKKTLFLDTDTLLLDSVSELFVLLDRCDVACCHAPYRATPGERNRVTDVPDCFPEVNSGLLAYNSSAAFSELVDDWQRIYSERRRAFVPMKRNQPDQPAFRQALYHSRMNVYILPPEYNLRTPMPMYKGAALNAKMLHGRGASLERAIREVPASGSDFGFFDFSDKPSVLDRAKQLAKRLVRRGWRLAGSP